MRLIEISTDKFINLANICSVWLFTQEQAESKDIGYGLKGRPRKVGETFTLRIATADGKEHHVNEALSDRIYDILFPPEA